MTSNKQKKKISVIMGVYNQKDRSALEYAINSILNQTLQDFEFLIYDDGSEEEEAQYLCELAKKDGRIQLLIGKTNQGLAHALNECLKVAEGDYIARMDGDDVSVPERFATQLQFLEEHKDCAFVGCAAKLFDADGVWGIRTMTKQPDKAEFLKFSPYIHPSVIFRKSVLKEAGGYLETNETRRCEDYELFMRLFCMGYHGYNLEEPLICYREDRTWYDKRNLVQRIAEMKIRYRGFQAMGILNIKTMLYVVKPVVLLLLPKKLCMFLRKRKREIARTTIGSKKRL